MGKYLFIIFYFVFTALAQAQFLTFSKGYEAEVKDITRLHIKLAQTTTDTTRVNALNSLARAYFHLNKDDSLAYYSKRALALSERINYPKGMITARTWLVEWLARTGNHPAALQVALHNLQQAEQTKDTLLIFWANRGLSVAYSTLNNLDRVLHYTRKNLQLVHSGYFKTQKDIKFYSLIGYLNHRGNAFARLNQLDSALHYRKRAYETALYLKNNDALALTTIILANHYLNTRNYKEAFYYAKLGTAFTNNAGVRFDRIADNYLNLARLFRLTNQPDSALYYGRLALKTLKGKTYPVVELRVADFLNEIYAKQGLIDSAYKYLHMAKILQDSIFSQDKVSQGLNFDFNERLRQQQIEQERKEAQQRYETKLKVYSLIGGLTLLVLLAFFLFRNNREKQKANSLLQQKNKQIQNALTELKATQAQLIQSEKMASLGELTAGIAHEIQNPLNFVNNFSEVNQELLIDLREEIAKGNTAEAKATAEALIENEQKIIQHGQRADAIVKNMLQHARTTSGEKQLTNLNTLAGEYLHLAYHGLRAKNKDFNCILDTNFDMNLPEVLVVSQEIGRVLLNLYNNAFYSVQQKSRLVPVGTEEGRSDYQPKVRVITKRMGELVEIRVQDNGIGLSESVKNKIFQPFFTTKPTGQGTGLGLSLSYDIIKAHGGELTVQTKEGEYAEFIIKLPA